MSKLINFKRKQLIAIEINWRANSSLKIQDFYDKWLKKFGTDDVIDRNLAQDFLRKLNNGEYDDAMNVDLELKSSSSSSNGNDNGVGGGENNDHVINDGIPEVAVSSSVNNDKESNKTTAAAAKRKNQKANGAAGGGKSQKNIILKNTAKESNDVDDGQQQQQSQQPSQEKPNKRPKRNNVIVDYDESESVMTSSAMNEPIEKQESEQPTKRGCGGGRKDLKNTAVTVAGSGDGSGDNRKLRGKKTKPQPSQSSTAATTQETEQADDEEIVTKEEPAPAAAVTTTRRGRQPRKPRN